MDTTNREEKGICDTCKRGKYIKNGYVGGRCMDCDNGSAWEPAEGIAELKPVIADSGDRREFGTGAVRDMAEGKGRMDLLPWTAIMEVAKHCERGAVKYGEHNVDRGIPVHSFIDSAARHLGKYIEGWEDEPHLVAAAWNLLWAIQTEIKMPELKDVPWKEEKK